MVDAVCSTWMACGSWRIGPGYSAHRIFDTYCNDCVRSQSSLRARRESTGYCGLACDYAQRRLNGRCCVKTWTTCGSWRSGPGYYSIQFWWCEHEFDRRFISALWVALFFRSVKPQKDSYPCLWDKGSGLQSSCEANTVNYVLDF